MEFNYFSKVNGNHVHSLVRVGAFFYSSVIFMLILHIYHSCESEANTLGCALKEATSMLILPESVTAKSIAILLVALSTAAFHGIYKSFIYKYVIIKFQDMTRKKNNNYRTYFKKRFDLSTINAQNFYTHLRDKYLSAEYKKNMVTDASYIHALYQSSICAMAFFIYTLFNSCFSLVVFYLLVSVSLAATAAKNDRDLESKELVSLRNIGDETIQKEFKEYFDLLEFK